MNRRYLLSLLLGVALCILGRLLFPATGCRLPDPPGCEIGHVESHSHQSHDSGKITFGGAILVQSSDGHFYTLTPPEP